MSEKVTPIADGEVEALFERLTLIAEDGDTSVNYGNTIAIAAAKLKSLKAEADRWEMNFDTAHDALAEALAREELSQAALTLRLTSLAEDNAKLRARVEEAVATVLWYDPRLDPINAMKPRRIIDGSLAFMDRAAIGAKLYAVPAAPTDSRALRLAIDHIEHMAAWIGQQNSDYSFESLGEDMPSIKAAYTETVAQRIEHAEPDEGRQDAGSTPAGLPPAAITERLIDAAIYAETASGVYVAPARREVNDARYAIEAEITRLRGALSSETVAREKAERERDEARADYEQAADWNSIVDLHGTDKFDVLADQWLAIDAIQRMHNAAASVFSKWSNDELMGRFKRHMTSIMHTAFVEGAIAGVRASETPRIAAAESIADLTRKLEAAAGALDEIARETTMSEPFRDHNRIMDRDSMILRAREARAAILGEEKS